MLIEGAPSQLSVAETNRRLHGPALAGVLLALMLTLLLEALDQTIVGTAMPRIIGQLHGLDRYTWAVSAYLLASTTLIPIAGKLSDQFGRKPFLLGGTLLFLLGSALCGAAQSIDQLIVFRALQGAGAGIGIALVFTVVGDIFPPAQRGTWQGVVNSVYAISAVIGPTLGGFLADHGPLLGGLVTDASRWRWVFYINLPLGAIALTVLAIILPADLSTDDHEASGWEAVRRIDASGAMLSALATLSLLLGLTWGSAGTSSWAAPRVIGALTAAALLYTALIAVERHAADPILPLDLFRQRVFATDAILSLLTMMALIGMAFYVPLYLQGVLGATATQSGAAMTPFSVSIALAGTLAGITISALKRHHGVVVAAALVMGLGMFLLTRMMPTTPLAQVSVFAAVAGAGMGALLSAVGVVALTILPPTDLGAGMGAVRYLGQIGGTVGAAIVGAVVNVSLVAEVSRRLPVAALLRLSTDGVTVTTNPQILVNPTYRAMVLHRALSAVSARIPPGPRHGLLVSAAARQTRLLLAQVFAALRLALAVAIQHGLLMVLVFCGAAVLTALLVRDVTPARPSGGVPIQANAEGTSPRRNALTG